MSDPQDQGNGESRPRLRDSERSERRQSRQGQGFSRQAPGERRSQADPVRLAAFEALRIVAEDDAYANLVLPKVLRYRRLQGRDAGFCTELVYGSLRSQGRLDAVLSRCIDRPLHTVDSPIVTALRMGAYQLLEMRVKEHAAVSETVALARVAIGVGPAQLINAVLRRVSERSVDEWYEVITAELEGVERLEALYAHPAWIVRAFGDSLAMHGRQRAELEALLESNNESPRVTMVARPGLADASDFADYEPALWHRDAAILVQGNPSHVPAIQEGRAGVQDEGSQIAARALAAAPLHQSGEAKSERWLDLCAGPGGKAALLAGLAWQQGKGLDAVEVAEHRAELVAQSLETLIEAGADVRIEHRDGTTVGAERPGTYARVLADVPCTGLGALRRRPESRWRRQPGDIGQLGKLQRQLLNSAIDAAAPGGVIGYVTCSPHFAETTLVVKDVLKKRIDVTQIDARPIVASVIDENVRADFELGDQLSVQLWPHVHGTDAMYICLLQKSA